MRSELTSRERVRLALNHQEPDRVPIDITWTKVPYAAARHALGLPDEVLKPDVWDRVKPGLDVIERLSVDFVWVGVRGPANRAPFSFAMDEWSDEWGVTFRKVTRPDQGDQFEIHDWPIKAPRLELLDAYAWPNPLDPARYEGVGDQVQHLYKTTDYALCGRLGDNIWEMGNYMAGQADWLMYVATDPDFCRELMTRVAAIQKQVYLEGLKHIGKYLSVVRLGGEDFGIQTGMLISPRVFRSLVKPILADVYCAVKERLADLGNYECKLMLHTCGAVAPIIPDLIEIGVDVLDPVQTRARGMNALGLKEAYGDRISFHGGLDTQGVIPFGTEEQVSAEVRQKIESFAPGGGYILCPTHNLQADVPGQNALALARAGVEYGRYPIERAYSREFLLAMDH